LVWARVEGEKKAEEKKRRRGGRRTDDTGLVGGDGGALDADVGAEDGICGVDGDLVVGGVAVLDAEVKVLDVEVEEGEDELVLDVLPDDPAKEEKGSELRRVGDREESRNDVAAPRTWSFHHRPSRRRGWRQRSSATWCVARESGERGKGGKQLMIRASAWEKESEK